MTGPRFVPPGQQPQQQGWVQMPVPSDAQIQAAQTQRPLNSYQQPQLQSQHYQQMQPGMQPPQMQQQPYQPPPLQMPTTQVIQSAEPWVQTPAPDLRPQQMQPQQPQQMPPSQQQPYLTNQQMAQQPQYQQPQMQQPQQPMGVQQAGGVRFDANGRVLAQPGVPQELVGRSINDVLSIYNTMRQAYVETQLQPQQQQRQQPQQQQQQPSQQQVNAQRKSTDFWADPVGTIRQIVAEQTAPITQATTNQQIEGVRQQLIQMAPDFAQYELGVMNRLRGAPPEVLTNPEAWRYAYLIEKGEQQFRQPQNRNNGFQQVGGQPQSQAQIPGWQQAPVGSFFTESPTAPQAEQMNAEQQLSPDEIAMAGKFGKSPAQWLAAKQGRFV